MPVKYHLNPKELKEELSTRIKKHNNMYNAVIIVDHFYDRNN